MSQIKCTRGLVKECTERGQMFEPREWNIRQKYHVCRDCQKEINKKYRKPKGERAVKDATSPNLPGMETATTLRGAFTKETLANKLNSFSSEIGRKPQEIFNFTDDSTLPRGDREIGTCPSCKRRAEISKSKSHSTVIYIHLAGNYDGQPRMIDFCIGDTAMQKKTGKKKLISQNGKRVAS